MERSLEHEQGDFEYIRIKQGASPHLHVPREHTLTRLVFRSPGPDQDLAASGADQDSADVSTATPLGTPRGDASPEIPLDHSVTEVLNLAKAAEFQGPEEPQALVDHRSL